MLSINQSVGGRFGLLVLGLALSGCGVGGSETAILPDSVRPGAQRAELQTLDADEGSGFRYELSVAPCTDDGCAVQIRLLERETAVDSSSLDWGLDRALLRRTEPGKLFGIGDPLASGSGLKAMSGTATGAPISVVARTIRLGGGERGLLVHQLAGLDHVKRRHYLYVRAGHRLERPWTGIEGAGPAWSAVQVLETPEQPADAFLYYYGFQYPNGYPPDDLAVTRLAWSPEENRLRERPAEGLWAAVLGPFPGADEARSLRSEHADCLADYWVLPADRFDALSEPGVALAAVTTRSALASRAVDEARKCVPGVVGAVSGFAAPAN